MTLVAWLDRHLTVLCGSAFAGVCLVLAVVFATGCQERQDGISPRDCADQDNAEVCEP